jgi:hypothetical protein
MKFESLYSINDILQYKYQGGIATTCFEVMEVHSVTCSAGTQIFYKLRPMNFEYEYIFEDAGGFKEGEEPKMPKRVKKFLGAMAAWVKDRPESYVQLREDEVIPASQQIKNLLQLTQ